MSHVTLGRLSAEMQSIYYLERKNSVILQNTMLRVLVPSDIQSTGCGTTQAVGEGGETISYDMEGQCLHEPQVLILAAPRMNPGIVVAIAGDTHGTAIRPSVGCKYITCEARISADYREKPRWGNQQM